MEYRTLGVDGPLISVIGFGSWPIGGKGYGPANDDDVTRAVHRAIERGITFFDTAPAYGGGYAEEFLGRVLHGRRRDVVLLTKGGLVLNEEGHIVTRDSRADSLVDGLSRSLRRLRTDYVDVFLIHWPDPQTSWEEAAAGLERILSSGMAHFVGVSNFHRVEMEGCRQLAPIIANQVAYNLLDRRWKRELFPSARALGLGIAAYSPLAHGLLSGRYRPDHRFAPGDWRVTGQTLAAPPYLVGDNFRRNLTLLERLRQPASQHGLTVAQLALAWVLQESVVAAAITSPRTVDQVEESVGGAEVQLTSDLLTLVDEVAASAAGTTAELPR
jgi:aryl-alcohol dehydrogenase-like predicted oxidoreductase